MAEPLRQQFIDVAQYLEAEPAWSRRHEYVGGQVYAMSGASMGRIRLVRNLSRRLDAHLESGACEVATNDLKLKVNETTYYYPDLIVTCESLPDSASICERAVLVAEVLSPTTARTDRVEKMNAYQHLDGLREYVLIAQDRIRVEVYRHERPGAPWSCEAYTEARQEIALQSIGATVSLQDLYRGVTAREQEGEETTTL